MVASWTSSWPGGGRNGVVTAADVVGVDVEARGWRGAAPTGASGAMPCEGGCARDAGAAAAGPGGAVGPAGMRVTEWEAGFEMPDIVEEGIETVAETTFPQALETVGEVMVCVRELG